MKEVIDGKVKERTEFAEIVSKEANEINEKMEAVGKAGEEAKAKMQAEQRGHQAAMAALQDLSGNDLSALIDREKPDDDLLGYMNGVMVLLGKEKGWKSV